MPSGGSVPNLPDAVTQDAYSHEVSSAGFWPGGQGIKYPAYYSYASPSPPGFSSGRGAAFASFWNRELNQYNLPYDVVRTACNPDEVLMEFLSTTYDAAASAGQWDRAAGQAACPKPRPGRPRFASTSAGVPSPRQRRRARPRSRR